MSMGGIAPTHIHTFHPHVFSAEHKLFTASFWPAFELLFAF